MDSKNQQFRHVKLKAKETSNRGFKGRKRMGIAGKREDGGKKEDESIL
jgi:hypothetical protein